MGRRRAAATGPPWYRELCDGWRRSLARRGRARSTFRTYGWLLRDLGRWLDHCRVDRAEDLVAEVLYSWQDELIERGQGPHTRAIAATVLRGVLRWGAREGLGVPVGLWERVDPVAVPEGVPRPLEPEDRDRLLAYFARRDRGLEQLRDRALFLFLLTTGSRIAAALRLDVDDVRGAGAIVVQKGGSQHRLLPSPLARAWLEQYLSARGRDDQPALWIRIGTRSRSRPRLRLSPTGANAIWTAVAKRARVPRFTNHVLKHTTATELGELTKSDQEIAEHIGWKDPSMMKRYRKVRSERRDELVAQLDQLVPAVPADPSPAPRRRHPRVEVMRGKTNV